MKVLIRLTLVAFLLSQSAHAEQSGPAGAAGLQKPLEIKGQTRNVSMMMVNQSGKNQVKFVKVRKDYKEEIVTTEY